MSENSSPKRVVFVHTDGLHEICGVLEGDVAPSHIDGPMSTPREILYPGGARLSEVTECAVYYVPRDVIDGEFVEVEPVMGLA